MQAVVFPIQLNERSANVARLQQALTALGYGLNADEIKSQSAGDSTTRIVQLIQSQNKIQVAATLLVDSATAAFLNLQLKNKGLLDAPVAYTISGSVLNALGEGLSSKTVVAYDVDLKGAKVYRTAKTVAELSASGGMQTLGSAVTAADGTYTINFTSDQYAAAELGLADVVAYVVQNQAGTTAESIVSILGMSRLTTDADYAGGTAIAGLNITLAATTDRGVSEYTRLLQAVNNLLSISGVLLTDISSSADQQAFVAKEIQQDTVLVTLLAQAAQLALPYANFPYAQSLLYGLGRENISLSPAAIATTPEDTILTAWKQAIADNIIDPVDAAAMQSFADFLHQNITTQVVSAPGSDAETTLLTSIKISTADPKLQTSFLNASRTFTGTPGDFWNKYLPSLPEFANQPQVISSMQLTNQLFALTGSNLPLVQALQTTTKIKSPADLFSLSDADWNALINKSGIPAEVPGDTDADKLSNYKAQLQTVLHAAYPTQTIAGMVASDQVTFQDAGTKDGLTAFFSRIPDFDISTSRIADFAQQLPGIAGANAKAVENSLGQLQRLFSVSPTPAALAALTASGYQSALQIASIPRQTFINLHATDLGGANIALAVHERAAFQSLRMQKVAMVTSELVNGITPAILTAGKSASPQTADAIIPANNTAADVQSVITQYIPNYAALFGAASSCECAECKSVYGAAAYLVDMLQFLGNQAKNGQSKSPEDVLLLRRKDIAYIPLTCENTNTLIPYIDLVNEIMEYYVVNGNIDAGVAYDTGDTSTGELHANPQNTLKAAYAIVKDAVYPFNLPYHQPLDTARVYFQQLNTTRQEIMTVLRNDPAAKADAAISAESLLLSPEAYSILTAKDFDGNAAGQDVWNYYNYPDEASLQANSWKVPQLMQRTGITYNELVNLLDTSFMNPGQPVLDYIEDLFAASALSSQDIYNKLAAVSGGAAPKDDPAILAVITAAGISSDDFASWTATHFAQLQSVVTIYEPASVCDISTATLRTLKSIYENQPASGISTDWYGKLHRFIRLWRITGYDVFEVDALISALGETDTSAALISKLGFVKTLSLQLSVPLDKLAVLWGTISTTGDDSLYARLFLNKASQRIDPVFMADKWGAYLTNPPLLNLHLPAVLAACRITAEDMDAIAADGALDLTTALLNISNLSLVYRYVVLSKALSLSPADLCTIKKLFALEPFTDPAATTELVTLCNNIQASGFSVAQLNFIIANQPNPRLGLGLTDAAIQAVLITIRTGFLLIDQEHPDSDLQHVTEDLVRAKMQSLYQPAIVERFLTILDNSAVFVTTTDKNLAIVIPAAQSNAVTYVKGSGMLQVTGVLSDDDQTVLQALAGGTANYATAVSDVYKQPEQFLQDNFSDLFGAALPDATKNLLDHPKQASPLVYEQKLAWFYQLFLPYLKNRLRQNLVVQNVSNCIALDEPRTQMLIGDTGGLANLLATFGLTATYFKDDAFTTTAITKTDNAVDFDWETGVPDTSVPANTFSARWQGLLAVPASTDYTLVVTAAEADDAFRLFIGDQLVLEKTPGNALLSFEDVATLKMGTLYPITLEYIQETGISGIHLYWKTATITKQVIDKTNLFPLQEYNDIVSWLNNYQRAAVFIAGFSLRSAELAHFIGHSADFDNIAFNNLTGLHWRRVFAYILLRKSIPVSTTSLIDVFELADQEHPAPLIDDVLKRVNAATGWNAIALSYLAKTQFALSVKDFSNEKALLQLLKAIQLFTKTGAGADVLCSWAAVITDFNLLYDQAQAIKNMVKSKFDDDLWLQVAKKLSDTIRDHQKNALIAYLLVQPALMAWGVTDADSLFDYFLIDVQMDACMDTSRIVQANAAVQLFVSRCQLGMESRPDLVTGVETGVGAGQIDAGEWSWMQYYRVWEANRKVFLYPENWLDPELRDDKSDFFTSLESELLQNDITSDTVETALYNYLDKLDQVAHLELCGMYQQNDAQGNLQTLHVFGRTHGKPHVYFYRTCDQFWHWSAWEKLPVDIKGVDGRSNSTMGQLLSSGVHLTPVVWKDRLFIFWPEFTKKQDDTVSANNTDFVTISKGAANKLAPVNYYEVSLGWSEWRNGKWLPKSISKEFLRPGKAGLTTLVNEVSLFSKAAGISPLVKLGVESGIVSHVFASNAAFVNDLKEYFLFPSINSDTQELSLSLIHKRTDNQGYFQFTDIRNPIYTARGSGQAATAAASAYDSFFMMLENQSGPLVLKGNTYLSRSLNHRILFSPQLTNFEKTLNYPFFYQDDRRAYFVRPTDISYWKRIVGTVKNPAAYYFSPIDSVKAAAINYTLPQGITAPASIEQNVGAVTANKTNSNVQPQPTAAANTGPAASAANAVEATFAANTALASAQQNNRISGAFSETTISGYRWPFVFSEQVFDKGLDFYSFYHPYVPSFIQNLNQGGVDLLMKSNTNNGNIPTPDDGGQRFESYYNPVFTNGLVQKPADFLQATYYKENVSFDEYATYASYNWELFYHVPLYIATRLSKNGKYADAMKWFQYIFDPSSTERPDPANPEGRFWKVLPFKQKISFSLQQYFMNLQPNQADDDISAWRAHPFDPFLVARDRPIAFMKNVVMKYVDNLIAWGDDLFRTDTLENINLATELYIIAGHILGPRPETVPERGKIKAETYDSLKDQLDAFSNAMVQLENLFPFSSDVPVTPVPAGGNLLGNSGSLYFCIPGNDNLLQYWDTVADRLFKIRHCLNIEGVFAPPALFAPPIDPGLLVRATAAGLSIGSILADLNSPAPFYRFNYLVQKAAEFCSEVKSLGNTLQAAIEKKDSEDLSRIKASQETAVLQLVTAVKQRQVLEEKAQTDNLLANRVTQGQRASYYAGLLGIDLTIPEAPQPLSDDDTLDENSSLPPDTAITPVTTNIDVTLVDGGANGVKIIPKEKEEMDRSSDAHQQQIIASIAEAIASTVHEIPNLTVDGKPLGVGAGTSWGGSNLGFMASSLARAAGIFGTQMSYEASRASRIGGFIRREQEWTQQANQALREIVQTDKQLIASYIRTQIASHELSNHLKQVENAKDMESYLQNLLQGHSKFSTVETYQWLRDQVSAVYKQAYQLAFDLAKKAEKAYQFELGISTSSFIQYGYFNSAYQGLTAGEQLFTSLKQMEKSYLETNRREFELTKHISLAQLTPDMLVLLQQTGACSFALPEELFDMDYPGHYFRRLKSVGISIPCIAGPYTTINATLRLQANSIRINILNGDSGYAHNNNNGIAIDDDRFIENNIPFSAIATSGAQNDSGVFELTFRDERYLPFEGAGAISTWRLELNGKYLQDDGTVLDFSQFDYNTIPDVVLHLRYTAREDAGIFRQNAVKNLQSYCKHVSENAPEPFMRLFDIRREFPNEWYQFLHPADITGQQVLSLPVTPERFSFLAQNRKINIVSVDLLASADNPIGNMQFNLSATDFGPLNLVQDNVFGSLVHARATGIDKTMTTNDAPWKISYPASGANNTPLTDSSLKSMLLIVQYELL